MVLLLLLVTDNGDDSMLLAAVQSSIIMLPVSIVLAMVFRNIRPKPTQQKLIKDFLIFDLDEAYGEIITNFENRRHHIDTGSFKSLSMASLPSKAGSGDVSAGETTDADDEKSSSSSSSLSNFSSDEETPDNEDKFVTPMQPTTAPTPDESHTEGATAAGKPDAGGSENFSQFDTALEEDLGTWEGPLPWWVGTIVWIIAGVAAVVMAFFIILYTFTFGLEKSKAFLVSVLTSFFFGMLLEQPIKILLVAFALAFICRKSADIYPTNLDIVADQSVRGTLPLNLMLHISVLSN